MAGFTLDFVAARAIPRRQIRCHVLSRCFSMEERGRLGVSKTSALLEFLNGFLKSCGWKTSVSNLDFGGGEEKLAVSLHLAHLG